MHRRLPIAALLVSAALVVSGCGGEVAVRSGFPPPAAPPAGGLHAGVSVSGGGGLTLAIVLGLIIADGIYWATRHPQPADDPARERPSRPLFQPIDRGWVDRGP